LRTFFFFLFPFKNENLYQANPCKKAEKDAGVRCPSQAASRRPQRLPGAGFSPGAFVILLSHSRGMQGGGGNEGCSPEKLQALLGTFCTIFPTNSVLPKFYK